MYPCNINKPIYFKTKSAPISKIVVPMHPKVLQFPECLCSVHLKVLQIPSHEKGGRPQGRKTGDPLCNPYVGKFQKNISM